MRRTTTSHNSTLLLHSSIRQPVAGHCHDGVLIIHLVQLFRQLHQRLGCIVRGYFPTRIRGVLNRGLAVKHGSSAARCSSPSRCAVVVPCANALKQGLRIVGETIHVTDKINVGPIAVRQAMRLGAPMGIVTMRYNVLQKIGKTHQGIGSLVHGDLTG